MKNPSCCNFIPLGKINQTQTTFPMTPPTTFSYMISQNSSFNSSVITEGDLFLLENTGLNLGWLLDSGRERARQFAEGSSPHLHTASSVEINTFVLTTSYQHRKTGVIYSKKYHTLCYYRNNITHSKRFKGSALLFLTSLFPA